MAIAATANPEQSAHSADTDFGPWLRRASILIVDDEPGMRNFLKRTLEPRCARIDEAKDLLLVRGTTHDNGVVKTVSVNGRSARILDQAHGVADWIIRLPKSESVSATAVDDAGNRERIPHKI